MFLPTVVPNISSPQLRSLKTFFGPTIPKKMDSINMGSSYIDETSNIDNIEHIASFAREPIANRQEPIVNRQEPRGNRQKSIANRPTTESNEDRPNEPNDNSTCENQHRSDESIDTTIYIQSKSGEIIYLHPNENNSKVSAWLNEEFTSEEPEEFSDQWSPSSDTSAGSYFTSESTSAGSCSTSEYTSAGNYFTSEYKPTVLRSILKSSTSQRGYRTKKSVTFVRRRSMMLIEKIGWKSVARIRKRKNEKKMEMKRLLMQQNARRDLIGAAIAQIGEVLKINGGPSL